MHILKSSQVFFIIFIFLGISLATLLLTELDNDTKEVANTELNGEYSVDAINMENYAGHIKPWLESAYNNYSLESIQETKANIEELRGSDKAMGSAHINLYLAFVNWEKLLINGDDSLNAEITTNLRSVASIFPELNDPIDNLVNLLN